MRTGKDHEDLVKGVADQGLEGDRDIKRGLPMSILSLQYLASIDNNSKSGIPGSFSFSHHFFHIWLYDVITYDVIIYKATSSQKDNVITLLKMYTLYVPK